jgi:hypothetical protein
MKKFSFNDAKRVMEWMWKKIACGEIPDQSVANLTMHIQMQFGNIRIVQLALNKMGENVYPSGRMDKKSLLLLQKYCREDANWLFNEIKVQVRSAYQKMYRSHIYIRSINKEFPDKFSFNHYFKTSYETVKVTFINMFQKKMKTLDISAFILKLRF